MDGDQVSIAERRTDRLMLRALGPDDLPALVAMHQNEDVMATLGGLRSASVTEQLVRDAVAHWDVHGFGPWTIRGHASGEFMGRGGLGHTIVDGRDEIEVAYALMPAFWRQGFATELARESVAVAFAELRLSDIVGFTQVTNLASRRVLDKAGFRFEREFVRLGLPHVLCRLTRDS